MPHSQRPIETPAETQSLFVPLLSRKLWTALLLVFGAAWMSAAAISLFISFRIVKNALRAEGTITHFEEHHERGGISKIAVFAFEDSSGIEHAARNAFASPFYKVGERVPLLYWAHEPTRAKIASFGSLWGSATFAGTIALISFMAALLVDRSTRFTKASHRSGVAQTSSNS